MKIINARKLQLARDAQIEQESIGGTSALVYPEKPPAAVQGPVGEECGVYEFPPSNLTAEDFKAVGPLRTLALVKQVSVYCQQQYILQTYTCIYLLLDCGRLFCMQLLLCFGKLFSLS